MGNPLISGKFRLVKYFRLARWVVKLSIPIGKGEFPASYLSLLTGFFDRILERDNFFGGIKSDKLQMYGWILRNIPEKTVSCWGWCHIMTPVLFWTILERLKMITPFRCTVWWIVSSFWLVKSFSCVLSCREPNVHSIYLLDDIQDMDGTSMAFETQFSLGGIFIPPKTIKSILKKWMAFSSSDSQPPTCSKGGGNSHICFSPPTNWGFSWSNLTVA